MQSRIALSCSLLLAGIMLSAQATVPAPGLLAAYALSNGTDASGANRTATLRNTTTVPGKYAEAQRFNGTSSQVVAPSMQPTTAFTLEAWVSPGAQTRIDPPKPGARGVRSTSGWQAIIYKNPDNFFLATANGFLTAGYVTGTTLVQVIAPQPYPVTSGWVHVAATYDGKALVLYVNGGVSATNTAATGPLAASSQPVEIGGSTLDQGWLTGAIDDVRIYSRALTSAELAIDMQTAIDAPVDPVVSWDVAVFARGVDPVLGSPIALSNFPKAGASCNLPPLTPPPATMPVQNPTHVRVTDPTATTRECEITAQAFFLTVPLGTGYTSTAAAKGASGLVSAPSPPSNAFDRVAEEIPPAAPGKPAVIAK